jgi:hypothetical protein
LDQPGKREVVGGTDRDPDSERPQHDVVGGDCGGNGDPRRGRAPGRDTGELSGRHAVERSAGLIEKQRVLGGAECTTRVMSSADTVLRAMARSVAQEISSGWFG